MNKAWPQEHHILPIPDESVPQRYGPLSGPVVSHCWLSHMWTSDSWRSDFAHRTRPTSVILPRLFLALKSNVETNIQCPQKQVLFLWDLCYCLLCKDCHYFSTFFEQLQCYLHVLLETRSSQAWANLPYRIRAMAGWWIDRSRCSSKDKDKIFQGCGQHGEGCAENSYLMSSIESCGQFLEIVFG